MSEREAGRSEDFGTLSAAEADRLLAAFGGDAHRDLAGLIGIGKTSASAGRTAGAGGNTSHDNTPDDPSTAAEAVGRVLAAASAPAQPHELHGYDSVRRAFDSGGGRTGTRSNRYAVALPLGRRTVVKLATLATTLTMTGVAVAAEANVLPQPIQHVAHQMLGGVGVPGPQPRRYQPTASGPGGLASSANTPQPSGSPGGRTTGDSAHGATPGSSPGQDSAFPDKVIALCRAFTSDDGGHHLSHAERGRLADLAGGESKIGDYCVRVLDSTDTGTPLDPTPSDGSSSTTKRNVSKAGQGKDRHHTSEPKDARRTSGPTRDGRGPDQPQTIRRSRH
jgi:hypothetical protein